MMEAEEGRREVNIREASPFQNQQFYENPRVNAREASQNPGIGGG